ncbi:MAG: hypothetical protein ACJASQ_003946 [Crocinitomicaceae bacterium]|jgi:hypothetical protein
MKAFQFSIILFSLFLIASCSSPEKPGIEEEVIEKMKYDFLWDFREIETFKYSYEVTSIENEALVRGEEGYSIKTEIIGDMIVDSHGDWTASISIEDGSKTLFSLTDDGKWSPAKPQIISKSQIGKLTQYSKFNDSRLDALWDAYLPLPLEEIEIGQKYKLIMTMPVSLEDNKYIRGQNVLTFMGYETIQNRKCVVLAGKIDVSQQDELEFEGEYSHSLKGTGMYYFDTKDHIYVGADVEITLSRKVDSGPKEDVKEDLFLESQIIETFKIRLK